MEIKYFGVNKEPERGHFWRPESDSPLYLGDFPLPIEVMRVRRTTEDVGTLDWSNPAVYLMTDINSHNKRAEYVARDVATIVSGQTPRGETVSLLTVVIGYAILSEKHRRFEQAYRLALSALAEQTQEENRFAFIAGGDNVEGGWLHRLMTEKLALMHRMVLQIPTKVLPCKVNRGETHVYLKNGQAVYVVETGITRAQSEPTLLKPNLTEI